MSKWIKYPEEKPDKSGRYVILFCDNEKVYSAHCVEYTKKHELFNASDDYIECAFDANAVIYWKALSEIQKEVDSIE